MTPEQALTNLSNVAAAFQGTLQQHQALQESLQVIGEALKPKPADEPESD
tara:strand:+ start:15781 stop:15930 length:150 start_codon:yes stop_codon:yes gene_type:complete